MHGTIMGTMLRPRNSQHGTVHAIACQRAFPNAQRQCATVNAQRHTHATSGGVCNRKRALTDVNIGGTV